MSSQLVITLPNAILWHEKTRITHRFSLLVLRSSLATRLLVSALLLFSRSTFLRCSEHRCLFLTVMATRIADWRVRLRQCSQAAVHEKKVYASILLHRAGRAIHSSLPHMLLRNPLCLASPSCLRCLRPLLSPVGKAEKYAGRDIYGRLKGSLMCISHPL